MKITKTAALAAGASVSNVLSGSQLEIVNLPSMCKFGVIGSAAGLVASIYSGADTILEESDVSGANRMPIDPDDLLKDVAMPGDRLKIAIRNPTGGSLTYFVSAEVVPVTGRR